MKRKVPGKPRTCVPWYQCPTRGCDGKIIKCDEVESAIQKAMAEWLDAYTLQINTEQQLSVDPIATALEVVQGQLLSLRQQQDSICEYLDNGLYTAEMFSKRNASLTQEIKNLQDSEADLLRQQSGEKEKKKNASQLIPTTQHILENYDFLSVEEKNQLWKLVLEKVTVFRSQEDELMIHIYPNLPK